MKIYLDPLSTTGRPLLALVAELGLALEVVELSIMQGEHLTDAFAALNPLRKLPVLVDGDFRLTESAAIMKYLADREPSPIYPTERKARARVDETMDWLATGLAPALCSGLVYPQIMPSMAHPDPAVQAALFDMAAPRAAQHLQHMEGAVLRDGPYLCGDALTLADYQALAMVSLTAAIQYDLSPYPRIRAWMERVATRKAWKNGNATFDTFVRQMMPAPH